MHDEIDDELTPEEREALASLAPEVEPPRDLEDMLVAELAARGEIHQGTSWWRNVAAAAVLLLAVGAGFVGGTRFASPVAPAAADARQVYALLIMDPVAMAPAAEFQAAVADAQEWAVGLAEAGLLAGAEKLDNRGSRVALEDGQVQLVADFPPAGASEVLGGFFLLYADSFEDAERIAADCPLLRYGSTIEIRAFEDIP